MLFVYLSSPHPIRLWVPHARGLEPGHILGHQWLLIGWTAQSSILASQPPQDKSGPGSSAQPRICVSCRAVLVLKLTAHQEKLLGLLWWLKQEMQVQSLVQEDPTCWAATKPVHHSYWECAPEPRSHNYWAHELQLLKPSCSRACAAEQKKPLQWEASPWHLEKSPCSSEDPAQPTINKWELETLLSKLEPAHEWISTPSSILFRKVTFTKTMFLKQRKCPNTGHPDTLKNTLNNLRPTNQY